MLFLDKQKHHFDIDDEKKTGNFAINTKCIIHYTVFVQLIKVKWKKFQFKSCYMAFLDIYLPIIK